MAGRTNRAKQNAYRQSDAGRLERKMYNMQPQVKAHKKIIRDLKKHAKGLA